MTMFWSLCKGAEFVVTQPIRAKHYTRCRVNRASAINVQETTQSARHERALVKLLWLELAGWLAVWLAAAASAAAAAIPGSTRAGPW